MFDNSLTIYKKEAYYVHYISNINSFISNYSISLYCNKGLSI